MENRKNYGEFGRMTSPESDSTTDSKSKEKKKSSVAETSKADAEPKQPHALDRYLGRVVDSAPEIGLQNLFQPKPKAEEGKAKSAEAEMESERLDAEEAKYAASAITATRKVEVATKAAEVAEGTTEAAAVSADEAFLDAVEQGLAADDGRPVEAIVDAAYEQVTGEQPPVEAAAELADSLDEPALSEAPQDEATAGMDYEDLPEEDEATLPSVTGAPYAAAQPQAGGGGRGTPPPVGVGNAGGRGGVPPTGPPNPNIFGNPNAWVTAEEADSREARARVGGALVAGVLAYLLGRSHGRKAERRRQAPVRKALEQQVQHLHDRIVLRETQIRSLVWERAAEPKREAAVVTGAPVEVRPTVTTHYESVTPTAREQRSPEAAKPAPKTAEQLHIDDVLKISETITVGSTTIRNVYETNLISERGLRRIVEAHIRGEDVRRVLTEEMLIKEISHELDPKLRDRPVAEMAGTATGGQTNVGGFGALGAGQSGQPTGSSNVSGDHNDSWYPSDERQKMSSILVAANITALAILGVLLAVLFIVWVSHR